MQVSSDLSRYRDTEIEHALSAERFERYMRWANNNRERAIEFYILNVRVSEAFYARCSRPDAGQFTTADLRQPRDHNRKFRVLL